MPIVRIENPEKFVGMDANEAKFEIVESGYECRIVHVDEHTRFNFNPKHDYDPLRMNLWLVAGKVNKAVIG
jgi:hypothetical protein